ncbi:hypothetical protein [Dactylosporangium matsuzakiense]|nr:hypothetical protein [Dactylosporangium matsuzakiense]
MSSENPIVSQVRELVSGLEGSASREISLVKIAIGDERAILYVDEERRKVLTIVPFRFD